MQYYHEWPQRKVKRSTQAQKKEEQAQAQKNILNDKDSPKMDYCDEDQKQTPKPKNKKEGSFINQAI